MAHKRKHVVAPAGVVTTSLYGELWNRQRLSANQPRGGERKRLSVKQRSGRSHLTFEIPEAGELFFLAYLTNVGV